MTCWNINNSLYFNKTFLPALLVEINYRWLKLEERFPFMDNDFADFMKIPVKHKLGNLTTKELMKNLTGDIASLSNKDIRPMMKNVSEKLKQIFIPEQIINLSARLFCT